MKKIGSFILFTSISMMAFAQEHGHQMSKGHEGHTMPNMNMSQESALLDKALMPKGQPLHDLPRVANKSKEMGVFQTDLVIEPKTIELIPNKPTVFWLYNGQILPLIEVDSGTRLKINIQNKLPQPTTIHWHGLPVTPEVDGNPQHPIAVNGSRSLDFTLPKDFSGTYWFHPHPHETTAEQVYRGLAGAVIVRDPHDPLKNIPEQNLFFSDLKLDEQGKIADNSMQDWMNGREGQFELINGQYQPLITLTGTQRWRIWNGNSARYLKLSFPENEVQVYQVASDGGFLEKPVSITTLLLTPGERVEVVLTPKRKGSFNLMALAYNRGKMGKVMPEKDLLLAKVNTQIGKVITLPKKLRDINEVKAGKVSYTVEYTEVANEKSPAGMDFLVNGKKHDLNRSDVIVKAGETQTWEIFNNSHMDHSFHMHGPQFQVAEYELNGKVTKPIFKELKDTINLKPYEKARIVFVEHDKGLRMYHCHILEHESLGMMGQMEVQ